MITRKGDVLIPAILLAICAVRAVAEDVDKPSKTVTSVLREPLPPEELSCRSGDGEIVIEGATYTYAVNKANGAISSLQVRREGEVVVRLDEPADILIDDYRLASGESSAGTEVVSRSDEQVVLKTEGVLKDPKGQRPDLSYGLVAVFYNDGVAVSELKLLPRQDILINQGISYHVAAEGRFSHYIHKRRDQHGSGSSWGALPESGKNVTSTTLTSCLEVFSPEAALAIFTDGGAIHPARSGLETAVLGVETNQEGRASVSLDQYVANIDSGGKPYLLKAGSELTFRVGISIAPNRLPHRRQHDLRHYVWIGDQKHPYPTDEEILDAARLGYTLFQMHRVGAPGKPRPPAGELERVIKKVHEAGMLFIWEVNADLIYASLERVSQMHEDGTWPLWQGFNYGGRYKASMDPYCDLVATCLASPNGLAEFRLECLTKMMEKYDVDGVYVDDNLAYANCPLWKEHGHPREVYDSLIELHEMNWRRRQLLRKMCPHAVLIDHCTKALILPVICDFDVHLYGEGYGLSSLEDYWSFFGSVNSMYAQGNLWAGDSEGSRCATAVAYNYDLLTGGGQYMYTDWRLYPEKFPYASGVTKEEPLIVRTYNLPQCYFGMYESTPHYFATSADVFSTTAPLTYATVYRNRVWEDYLIPMANMSAQEQETSLVVHASERLGVSPSGRYLLYDVNYRTTEMLKGEVLAANGIGQIVIPGQGLRLFYLRKLPEEPLYHLWGGKRIRETWDSGNQRLTFEVHGPLGLQDTVFVGVADGGVGEVKINGERAEFFFDPSRRLAHGTLTFSRDPVTIEVAWSPDNQASLPEKTIMADQFVTEY